METDIDTTSPLQYTPELAPVADSSPPESAMREESQVGDDRDYYSEQHQYPQYMYEPPPASAATENKTFDLTRIDQSTMIVCFGAFLLGFIISKLTMQPIILKQ